MIRNTEQITLNNGIKITVPSDKDLITNYVLKEQGDWFEREIRFVKEFIQPDMHVLDIGANFGLYTSAIANNLSDNGHLWSFEPTPNTAKALRETLGVNELDSRVTLIEKGLSGHVGQASFHISDNSELNSLTKNVCSSGEKITIELVTLDSVYEEYSWPKLDFIKLDAEGEELKILEKGKKTLSECSPLIMFEIKNIDNTYNEELIHSFEEIGYSCYCLIPGLNILIPFDFEQLLDGFLINLFCCKEETATDLREQGVLVSDATGMLSGNSSSYSQLSNLVYFKELAINFNQEVDDQYRNVLEAYSNYRNEELSKKERYENLLYAFGVIKKALSEGESNIAILSTYARIAFDIGQQSLGMQVCQYIFEKYIKNSTPFKIDHPFVPVSSEFENVSLCGKNPNIWLCCSVADALIRNSHYSSYYNGETVLPLIKLIERYDFLLDDIAKRKEMIEARKVNVV